MIQANIRTTESARSSAISSTKASVKKHIVECSVLRTHRVFISVPDAFRLLMGGSSAASHRLVYRRVLQLGPAVVAVGEQSLQVAHQQQSRRHKGQ